MQTLFKNFMEEVGEWANFEQIASRLRLDTTYRNPLTLFNWKDTPQGEHYWRLLSKLYQDRLVVSELGMELTLFEKFYSRYSPEEFYKFQKTYIESHLDTHSTVALHDTPASILEYIREFGNLSNIISNGFVWVKTKEGTSYWSKINSEYTEMIFSFRNLSSEPRVMHQFPITTLELFLESQGEEVLSKYSLNLLHFMKSKDFKEYTSIPDFFRKEGNTSEGFSRGFVFADTREGHSYWFTLYLKYEQFHREMVNRPPVEEKREETYLKKYLKALGEEIELKFKANMEKEGKHFDSYVKAVGNFSYGFSGAFTWEDSPEGEEFWREISESYKSYLEVAKCSKSVLY